SAAALTALRERTTSFAGLSGVGMGNAVLTGTGDPEQVSAASVTAEAFDVLRSSAAIGHAFGVSDPPDSANPPIVLVDGLWRRRYGADASIVGRTIEVDGSRRMVVGVMPAGFRVPTYEAAE